jgi:iron(III) transport system substrate-binding protein
MNLAISKALARRAFSRFRTWIVAAMAGLLMTGGPVVATAAEINIYSHRQQFLLQPFLDAFTAETGSRHALSMPAKGLAQRLLAEGEASPADVILTVDIARLSEYADLDLLAPVRLARSGGQCPGASAGLG